MIDISLVEECAPLVHPATMQTLVKNESSGNPYAIGVVDLELVNQPQSKTEAIDAAKNLMDQGYNVSLGLGQINMHNFEALGLTVETAFEPCENLRASSEVLNNCFDRALDSYEKQQEALRAALSCYYSNNFTRGFQPDDSNGNSYIERFLINRQKIPSEFYASASGEYQVPDFITNFTQEVGLETTDNQEVELRAVEDTVPHDDGPLWDVFNELSS
ncbi:lytic transglycosylase domain-containing protein [Halomonas sp. 3D7M]|uniref:lytic transglycosylase domain-containing protein n=1 Tax=Halomonas sp. 3D7M TaxID=2742617 RepID=UPI0018676D4F|nr:lytic transglycosylase domain-containing protein [Halomonas sp. 3D7M]